MIDQFTKEEFEEALPIDSEGASLWEYVGLFLGEHTYEMPVVRKDGKHVKIKIRSSVAQDGVAADTGKDSIRLWLEAGEEDKSDNFVRYESLGKLSGRYITRVSGWQDRLKSKLRELYSLGQQVKQCPECGDWKVIRTVRNGKPENKGRVFSICRNCDRQDKDSRFEWLT